MSDIKCPFCQQAIVCTDAQDADEYATWFCPRCVAERKWCAFGNKKLWQELIRTRKALEWARHFLKEIRLRYLVEKDNPSRQNKWVDTALYMYNCAESFFDDYDKTNETKGGNDD